MGPRVSADFLLAPWAAIGEHLGALLVFRGRLTPPSGHPLYGSGIDAADRFWLRGKRGLGAWVIDLPVGPDRQPDRVWDKGAGDYRALSHLLRWADVGNPQRPARRIVLCSRDAATSTLLCEVFSVLSLVGVPRDPDRDGHIEAQPVTAYSFPEAHASGLPTIAIAPATAFFAATGVVWSDIPYRADPTVDTWLSVNVGSRALAHYDWEYDLEGGTPTGQYDLRCAVQNFDLFGAYPPSSLPPFTWPPPMRRQSLLSPGSSDVGCFRWEPNPTYDAADPTSPKYAVWTYGYVLTSPPTGTPISPSGWTVITAASRTVEQMQHDPQTGPRPISLAARHFEHLDGANGRTVWGIQKEYLGRSRFRYRYPCTLNVSRHSTTAVEQSAHIYLPETRPWRAYGVLVLRNGATVYEDLPQGIQGIERFNEGAFGSNGGFLRATSPVFTTSWRNTGLSAGSLGTLPGGARVRLYGDVLEDGDFWAVVQGSGNSETAGPLYLARRDAAFELPAHSPGGIFGAKPRAYDIREREGRVWVFNRGGGGELLR